MLHSHLVNGEYVTRRHRHGPAETSVECPRLRLALGPGARILEIANSCPFLLASSLFERSDLFDGYSPLVIDLPRFESAGAARSFR